MAGKQLGTVVWGGVVADIDRRREELYAALMCRYLLLIAFVILPAICGFDQGRAAPQPEDVSSINAIITASYAALSHASGKRADLERFQSLFRPGAVLMNLGDQRQPAGIKEGTIEEITKMLESTQHPERAHFETELARRTEQWGNLAHVWSTYQSTGNGADPGSRVRGINSISLVNDGHRWWIVSAQWQNESSTRPVPRRYLQGKR